MATVSFDPMQTSAPQNSFLLSQQGYVAGAFLDDPSSRMWLLSGRIASSVTGAVYGGLPITEGINAPGENAFGNTLTLAASNSAITAFTVFNQAHNMMIVPGNSAQMATAGMTISYFRLGSNARIVVPVDTSLIATLDSGATNQQVSWDFTNNKLIAYSSTVGALACKVLAVDTNSALVEVDSTTGALSWTTGAVAIIQI
ncbi:hypothetical protein [Robbsia andropogonis]|uniref:hypothetical protein n=1 Tax=Robbsia andropogonis TaxID=28092 RepID=UPI002A6B7023|nr:hypothetical protein [Robbsia andropogonis]